MSIYVTYFSLYDGVVWPQCANQANWDEYGKCLRAGADMRGLSTAMIVRRSVFAAIKLYPCDTDWLVPRLGSSKTTSTITLRLQSSPIIAEQEVRLRTLLAVEGRG